MANEYSYDVFLSHSTKDKPVVHKLAQRLKKDGLRVWLDDWVIKPGHLIPKQIDEGLQSSRVLVLCMSKHFFASEWLAMESGSFRFRDPTNKERRFIPVLLDKAHLPDTLRQFAWLDWGKKPDETVYRRLLEAIRLSDSETTSGVDQPRSLKHAVRILSLEKWWGEVNSVAFSPDGRRVAAGSDRRSVGVWSTATGRETEFRGHHFAVYSVAWSGDGRRLASGSYDRTARVWNVVRRRCEATLQGHTATVSSVAWSGDGRRLATGSHDKTVRVWSLAGGECVSTLQGHAGEVSSVAFGPDGLRVASGSDDGTVRVWDIASGRCIATLKGHTGGVWSVAWSSDGRRLASGSFDKTVRLWDSVRGRCEAALQGHTADVTSVSWSGDGRQLASGSEDQTVRVWDVASGRCEVTFKGHTAGVHTVAWSGDGRRVNSAAFNGEALGWSLEVTDQAPEETRSRYTNAKVLLVGDSAVGKTGLAHRLTENQFRESVSTDGAWATHLPLPHAKSTKAIEREIWLWDFAGQADYRLIHQLFMDETALAVLVFNPQSENPFEGLGQWERDLRRAARGKFRKLLVAARCDRGGLMVSRKSLEQFRKERDFAEYIETSARLGTGCDKLRKAIARHIDWNEIPWESSPTIFQRLKDEIINLRDAGWILLRLAELKQQLELRLPGESFTPEELRAVVGLLAGPGIVWKLEFGDFVLLKPERINAYAAAVIRKVRAHTEEIGCMFEEDVLAGRLDYQDMTRLPADEEAIVLRAMHQTLVDHGLCLREHTAKGTLLIFPSYFKRERPELGGHPVVLVTYQFNGPLDEIYATLVVRLHHTEAFEKKQLWQFAADFKTQTGKLLGLKLTKKAEGAGELDVYFERGISNETQVSFIRYVHEHLMRKAHDVVRQRHFVCDGCGTPVENQRAIALRMEKGLKDIVCAVCEERVLLWDPIEEQFASPEFIERVRLMEEQARAVIDNESRELILVGHAYAIAGEAGQIYRQYASSDHGIDGEIEFKDQAGKQSGRRLLLLLKSGDSYSTTRNRKESEVFTIKDQRRSTYWRQQADPVMLVTRSSDGAIRWMDVTEYLRREAPGDTISGKEIVFDGEPFTALTLLKYRKKALGTL